MFSVTGVTNKYFSLVGLENYWHNLRKPSNILYVGTYLYIVPKKVVRSAAVFLDICKKPEGLLKHVRPGADKLVVRSNMKCLQSIM